MAGIGDAIAKVVAEQGQRMRTDLQALVRLPTISGDEDLAEPFLTAWFSERGWSVDRQVFATSAASRTARGLLEPRPSERANIIGWLGSPSERPVVTLNAHYDVVPVFDQADWTDDPFSGLYRDGAVYGRGSVDNKGGCVAALYAIQALADLGVELAFDVAVELVMAEETTGIGTTASLERLPARLATIVLEPTDGAVVTTNSGALFFTIEVEGQAVHTSVPWRGEDALAKLVTIYDALLELGERRNASHVHDLMRDLPSSVPLVIGTMSGGGWRASVPAHASLSGRIGTLPGEDLGVVRSEMIAAVADVAARDPWLRDHPPAIRWDNDGLPGWDLDPRHLLPASFAVAQRAAGRPERTVGITSGCDAGTLVQAGIPVVVFGPGDMARAHSPNEFVREDEVRVATEMLAMSLIDLSRRVREGEPL